ncbi:uncharacterized protein C2845_PM01G24420 [Panicum miliaceum]|uniref:Uncharacterized protein n=1 Tax=Panicum miliaceum TaxID=4540 RepID=A0A3L6TGU5_PANMI|nr:uncharacterized protein C2845_PM01G24420 [Panicum miliaceum]
MLSFSSADHFAVPNHDPQCGVSKEEFEWRCSRAEKIRQRIPQALHKLKVESEKVRHHFSDDPEALEKWDEYMDDINYAFSSKLTHSLSSHTQDSGLYKLLMKEARPKTVVGMLTGGYDKLKGTTRSKMGPRAAMVGAAAAFAFCGSTLWKQWQTETKEAQ